MIAAALPVPPLEAIPVPPALDERFMRMALALGERHLGQTAPNPSVGAVVVDGRRGEPRVVARGVTQPGGRPHAERLALERAGEAARGATLYVSLEPCSHHGKTPPCVDAIAAAGIARVVTAIQDPDPRVSGRGHEQLRMAGIALTTGILAQAAARAHRGHICRVAKGRPSVTLKLARTADGFAAPAHGPRLLITGEAANARVHLMRAHVDAILVGVGTILADDPRLTVRLPGLEDRSPLRVVLDSRLGISPRAHVAASAREQPTWIIAGHDAPLEAERRLVAAGVEVMRVGVDQRGRVRLGEALGLLALRGITRVFCEGGPTLADAMAGADLVDEIVVVTGERILGEPGRPALGPGLSRALAGRFRCLARDVAGGDVIEHFERQG